MFFKKVTRFFDRLNPCNARIKELEKENAEWRQIARCAAHLATRDPLTGLVNKRGLDIEVSSQTSASATDILLESIQRSIKEQENK